MPLSTRLVIALSGLRRLSRLAASGPVAGMLLAGVVAAIPPQDETPPALEVVEAFRDDGSVKERYHVYRDEEGSAVLHGEYVARYSDGKVSSAGEYLHGKRDGKWRFRHDSGKLASTGNFKRGERHGTWTFRHPNGKTASTGRFDEGQRVGLWSFYDEKGEMDRDRSCRYAPVNLEYGPGVPRLQGQLRDGVRDGRWVFFWENGRPMLEGEYRDGLRHGPWRFHHVDGSYDPMMLSGRYENGLRLEPAIEKDPSSPGAVWLAGPVTPGLQRLGDLPAVELPPELGEEMARKLRSLLVRDVSTLSEEEIALIRDRYEPRLLIPLLLAHLRTLDLSRAEDQVVFDVVATHLHWLCLGNGFSVPSVGDEGDHREHLRAALRWYSFWRLVEDDEAFWGIDFPLAARDALDRGEAGAAPSTLPLFFEPAFHGPRVAGELPVAPFSARGMYADRFDHDRLGRRAELIDAALFWLASRQTIEGRWDARGVVADEADFGVSVGGRHDVGVTALALLAFLGEGNTPTSGPHRQTVLRAARWLTMIQDPESGRYAAWGVDKLCYDHVIATLAMCEAAAVTSSPAVRRSAQRGVDFLQRARCPYNAWRYAHPQIGDNDSSVTAWAVQALVAADRAGLEIDEDTLIGALSYFDEVTDPATGRAGYNTFGSMASRYSYNEHFPREHGEAMSAAALVVRILLGQIPAENDIVRKHARLVARRSPEWDLRGWKIDMVYWFYGAQGLHQLGGSEEKRWDAALLEAVGGRQRRDGGYDGSWDPAGPWGPVGGRIYSTAMVTLALQGPYRLARLADPR